MGTISCIKVNVIPFRYHKNGHFRAACLKTRKKKVALQKTCFNYCPYTYHYSKYAFKYEFEQKFTDVHSLNDYLVQQM